MQRRVPLYIKIIYALGQFGWSLCSYGLSTQLFYFFVPPDDKSGIPKYLNDTPILGVFTWLGFMALLTLGFDIFANIWVAGASDRSQSKLGKRRVYMWMAIVPFALSSVLVFFPPSDHHSTLNIAWILFFQVIYYIGMAFYVTPFTAMMSDLGEDEKDRLLLSTLISVTWALGFAVGSQVYSIKSLLEPSMGSLGAFRFTLGMFAIIGFVFMLLPLVFIRESIYGKPNVSNASKEEKIGIGQLFKDKAFSFFISSDFFYWIASNTLSVCLVYYVVNLLKAEEKLASLITVCILVLSFVSYPFLNMLSAKFGKSVIQKSAYLVQAFAFLLIFTMGWIPIPVMASVIILGVTIAFPIASFGILPNAILSDIIEYKNRKDGLYMPALYFSMKAVFMKIGIHMNNVIVAALLPIGKGSSEIGVRFTSVLSIVASLIALALFFGYKESEVLKEKTNEKAIA